MDDIFTELNLETLAAVFRREIIVPSIFQSMSNEKIERLVVTASGDRVRLLELCKDDECWKPLNKQNRRCTLS